MSSPALSNSSLPQIKDLNPEVTSQRSRARPQEFRPVMDMEENIVEDTETISRKRKEKNVESSNSEGASNSEIDESDAEDASPTNPYYEVDEDDRLPPPEPSPNPYIHPEISEEEIDFDWGQYQDTISEADKRRMRKQHNKLFCVGMSSTVSAAEITWCMTYYGMEGQWARPPSMMRPHIFKWPEPFKVPRMVTSPKLMSLGVGAPLHPYLKNILEWYNIAPIQLSPNSYKLALALFILYHDEGISSFPTMEEFSYFFAIRKSSKGYYFLTPQHKHNKMGFSDGKISNEKNWKEPFFYLWNVDRVRVVFNCNYNNRNIKELFGEAKKRADKIVSLPPSRFNLKTLITEDNLKRVGIFRKEVGSIIPFQRFRKGIPIKGSKDCDTDDEEEAENEENFNVEEGASSQPGMDGLPSGWGLESGVAPAVKVAKRKKTRAHRKDTQKPSEVKKSQIVIDPEGRKRKEKSDEVMAATDASSKKLKSGSSFSLVSAALSPLAIPYVSDEEIIKWKNRDSLSENEAIIKASSEILVSALNRQASLQQDRTRLKSLEKERDSFAKQVKDQNAVIEDLQNELNCNKSFYETELKTQEEVNEGLNTTINMLREEKEGWVLEKKKIEKASFRDGFRNYASGFLAQDPDYDFSKFGEETVAWIAKFKIEEAAGIKAKRIFLGLEKASPVLDEESEDASSDGIPDHTFDDPPHNESAPAKVPEDSQVVEKVNEQTQDAS